MFVDSLHDTYRLNYGVSHDLDDLALAQKVLARRQKITPRHVLSSMPRFFSNTQTKHLETTRLILEVKLADAYNQYAVYEKWKAEGNSVSLVPYKA